MQYNETHLQRNAKYVTSDDELDDSDFTESFDDSDSDEEFEISSRKQNKNVKSKTVRRNLNPFVDDGVANIEESFPSNSIGDVKQSIALTGNATKQNSPKKLAKPSFKPLKAATQQPSSKCNESANKQLFVTKNPKSCESLNKLSNVTCDSKVQLNSNVTKCAKSASSNIHDTKNTMHSKRIEETKKSSPKTNIENGQTHNMTEAIKKSSAPSYTSSVSR